MNRERILLVEDESIVAADIKLKLENLGYTVTGMAANGADALARARADRPDLVLMDITLAGPMDGIQTARIIREELHLPVIYLTACTDRKTIERACIAEPFGFIHKPLDERELSSGISMALYKHAIERQLHASEERLAATLASMTDAVITTNPDGLIDFVNTVAGALLEKPPEQLRGLALPDCCTLRPAETAAPGPLAWPAIMSAADAPDAAAMILTTPAGRQRRMKIRVTAMRRPDGALMGFTLVCHDVTERQQTLNALRQSERKYRAMLEAMPDQVYICDADYRLEYLNPAMVRQLKRDATGELCHQAIFRRDNPCPWCPRAALAAGRSAQCETTRPDDGRTFRIACTAVANENRPPSCMLIVTDITESKQAEQALQESETRYKRLVASVTDYIYSVKIEDGRVLATFHGQGCIAVTGYSTAEYEADPDLWFKMVHPDDRAKVLDQARRLIAGEPAPPLEHRIIHKTGKICWVRNTSVIHRDSQGRVVAYDGLVSNITERKMAEEQINEHARKLEIINRIIVAVNKAATLANILDEALISALALLQFRGGCVYLVDEASRTAEMRCVNGCPADFIAELARLDLRDRQYDSLFVEGRAAFADDCQKTEPDFARKWKIAALARLPLISQEKIIGMLMLAHPLPHPFTAAEKDVLLSIARQIGTALAKTSSELALRESENRYRTMTEQSLVGVQIIKDGRLLFVNEGWTEITGYTRHEIESWTDRDFIRIIHPDDQQFFMEHLQNEQALTAGDRKVYDCRFIAQSGATKWVALHVRAVNFADGPATMAIIVDITNRKLAEQALAAANQRLKSREEQLRAINQELCAANDQLKSSERNLMAANRDKEILLKEIHHRVKNNLQVISSLLKLQIAHVDDIQARQVIRECQNRIKSIAIVHEKLYQAPNLAEINVGEYIQSLTKHLFRTFLVDPESISIEIDAGDVALGIDKAIPCSLLINELVSNSLKYAFARTKAGAISIKLQAAGAKYILEVADSGCGIPDGIDFRNTATLGMQLVMTFVAQLGGAITLDKSHGTRFIITFTDEKKAVAPA